MCGGFVGGLLPGALGGGKKSSGSSSSNAAAEQRAAEIDAINKANAGAAMRRKALRENSLFTGAGEADKKTTLGVGG
jgi:hypothetical protein